jgi:hypothetical protein
MLPLALLLLGIIPHDDVARETVDLAELNHFYDEYGKLVFDQVIFYDWAPPYAGPFPPETTPIIVEHWRFQVRAWRLVRNPSIIPQRDWERGGYRSLWYEGEQLRDIHAASFRETWTQYDPELVERQYLPKERRPELRSKDIH